MIYTANCSQTTGDAQDHTATNCTHSHNSANYQANAPQKIGGHYLYDRGFFQEIFLKVLNKHSLTPAKVARFIATNTNLLYSDDPKLGNKYAIRARLTLSGIAQFSGIPKRAVQRAIKLLVKDGILNAHNAGSEGKRGGGKHAYYTASMHVATVAYMSDNKRLSDQYFYRAHKLNILAYGKTDTIEHLLNCAYVVSGAGKDTFTLDGESGVNPYLFRNLGLIQNKHIKPFNKNSQAIKTLLSAQLIKRVGEDLYQLDIDKFKSIHQDYGRMTLHVYDAPAAAIVYKPVDIRKNLVFKKNKIGIQDLEKLNKIGIQLIYKDKSYKNKILNIYGVTSNKFDDNTPHIDASASKCEPSKGSVTLAELPAELPELPEPTKTTAQNLNKRLGLTQEQNQDLLNELHDEAMTLRDQHSAPTAEIADHDVKSGLSVNEGANAPELLDETIEHFDELPELTEDQLIELEASTAQEQLSAYAACTNNSEINLTLKDRILAAPDYWRRKIGGAKREISNHAPHSAVNDTKEQQRHQDAEKTAHNAAERADEMNRDDNFKLSADQIAESEARRSRKVKPTTCDHMRTRKGTSGVTHEAATVTPSHFTGNKIASPTSREERIAYARKLGLSDAVISKGAL